MRLAATTVVTYTNDMFAGIIVLQVMASAVFTIVARVMTLRLPKAFFTIGIMTYIPVVLAGAVAALLYNGGIPSLPSGEAWVFIAIEGVAIPAYWLLQYKLLRHIGAVNTAITMTLSIAMTSAAGVLLLGELAGVTFILGTVCIVAGTVLSVHLRPDETHASSMSTSAKMGAVVTASTLATIGFLFEKKAIDAMGVWDYTLYGWLAQLVGVLILSGIFGRSELRAVQRRAIAGGAIIGVLTAISGMLFVYALYIGSLSHTIAAAGGKIGVTMILAAIFLKERNSMGMRVFIFALAMLGLWLIVQ